MGQSNAEMTGYADILGQKNSGYFLAINGQNTL
jgi:hypothetical protein